MPPVLRPICDLRHAFESRYETDACFVPYHIADEDLQPRINKDALATLNGQGKRLQFDIIVIDIDAPNHTWTDEWGEATWAKIQALDWFETCGWYRTPNGWRLIWLFDEPCGPDEYERRNKRFRRALAECGACALEADKRVWDWTRVWFLPRIRKNGRDLDLPMDLSNLDILIFDFGAPDEAPETPGGVDWGKLDDAKLPVTTRYGDLTQMRDGGGRREALFSFACKLRGDGYPEPAITAAVHAINAMFAEPKDAKDVDALCADVIRRYPAGAPILIAGVSKAVVEAEAKAADKERPFESDSDAEFALRIFEKIEANGIKIVEDRGTFWRYDPEQGIWGELKDYELKRMVMAFHGADLIKKTAGKVTTVQIAINNKDVEGTVKLIEGQRKHEEFFDRSPRAMAFNNGCVFVSDDGHIHIKAHAPEHRKTFKLPYDYVPGQVPERFLAFLAEVWPNQKDMSECAAALQEFVGLCLFGHVTKFAKAVVLLGEGGDGKSVLINLLEQLFPPGASVAVQPHKFKSDYSIAELAGKLLNICFELPDAEIDASDAFKAVISGDRLEARSPYKRPFYFRPQAGHLFAANSMPSVKDFTHGFWRRWIVLPFFRKLPEHKQDPQYLQTLASDLPAIASWAVEGAARALRANNITIPSVSHDLKDQWRAEVDSVAGFLNERCFWGSPTIEALPVQKVYAEYRLWCQASGHSPCSKNKFSTRAVQLGAARGKTGNSRWLRVQLRDQEH